MIRFPLLLILGAAAAVMAADPTVVDLELESGSMTGGAIVANSEASGGQVVQFTTAASGSVTFNLPTLEAGTWYVWIRTYAKTSEENGLFMELDGKSVVAPAGHLYAGIADIYLKKVGWSWEAEWQGPGHGVHAGPITINLTAGAHQLTIKKRKTERPLIDRIILSKSSTPPAPNGKLPLTDTTPPLWTSSWPSINGITSTGFTVRSKTNEVGRAYYLVVAAGAAAPTSAQVKAGVGYGGVAIVAAGNVALVANTEATAAVGGLAASTGYDTYVVAQDAVPNLQTAPVKVAVTTLAIPPPTIPAIPSAASVANEHSTTPTFSGTVGAGQTVHVFVDAVEIGTVVANGSGVWSYTPGTALSQGSHSITLTASVGSGTPSGASAARIILVDTIAPAQPPAPTLGGTATAPVVSGTTAESNARVRILVDGAVVGTVAVGAGGAWTSPVTTTEGTHQVTVQILDAAGNASVASSATPVTIVAPPSLGHITNAGSSSGGCGAGGLAGLVLGLLALAVSLRPRR